MVSAESSTTVFFLSGGFSDIGPGRAWSANSAGKTGENIGFVFE
jgi:hypothetical protein